MDRFYKQLERELDGKLAAMTAERDPVIRNSNSVKLVKDSINQLREYARVHPFGSLSEEVHYFKDLAPRLYGALFYFLKVYQVELERKHAGPERMEVFLQQELRAIEQFFRRNGDFCRYFYMQATCMDEILFTRKEWENAILEDVQVIMEMDYCLGSYWVARLKANEQLRGYLKEQREALRQPPSGLILLQPNRKLTWKAGKANLVALCKWLHRKGGFGDATLKEIVEWFEANTEIDPELGA